MATTAAKMSVDQYGTTTGRYTTSTGTTTARARKTPLFRLAWIVEFDLQDTGGWTPIAPPFEDAGDAASLYQDRVMATGLTSRYRFREGDVPGDETVTARGAIYGLRQAAAPSKHLNFPQMQENPFSMPF